MSYLSDLPFSDQDGIERRVIRQDLSQVYGLGDFWFDIFEDSDVVQDLLGAQAITHADLYSRMLQLFTGISLDGMAQALHSELKLEILELDPLQLLSQTEFPLPESVISSRFIGNTPVLPSVILEKGVDYVISEDGKSIRFADAQCLEFFASDTPLSVPIHTLAFASANRLHTMLFGREAVFLESWRRWVICRVDLSKIYIPLSVPSKRFFSVSKASDLIEFR